MDFAVSSAITNQDQSEDGDSCAIFPGGNGMLLYDSGQLFTTDEGYVLKIRKPYTITKQREKWTEEEHRKFIEALKLYGRAWRKIEEHVGTKTAVQIRSHAQKFFSKVVRESKSTQCTSTKPIEIPPPRPKKKPMHPYPRKLALPAKTDMSTSPNSSSVDQEQQSPTSVLSAFVSETVGSADSGMLDGISSPLSQSDAPILPMQQLELFPEVGFFIKEGSIESTSTKTVKLFGKTFLLDNAVQETQPNANLRGFVPYKRSLSENEMQRTRLCL